MDRVSSGMPNYDMQYYLRKNSKRLNDLQNKVGSNTRVLNLRDDPAAVANATRIQSKIDRLKIYQRNSESLQSNIRVAEGYLNEVNGLLHNIREVAIKGANGIYNLEDRKYMAAQIDQMLNEVIHVANQKNDKGVAIFSGTKLSQDAFRAVKGAVPGAGYNLITEVEYIGDIGVNSVEVSEGSYVNIDLAGDKIFWARLDTVFSSVDASQYKVLKNSSVLIDNTEVKFRAGDNIYTIAEKINRAGLSVSAQVDPSSASLNLVSTVPHQMWLEDFGDGTVFRDLGIVKPEQAPPLNIANDALRGQGSVFSSIIELRDALYRGDVIDIGGKSLKGIDMAQENIISSLNDIGNVDSRLDVIKSRIAMDIPEYTEQNDKEVGLDLVDAITEMKELESLHTATLQTSAKVIQPSLLDFIR